MEKNEKLVSNEDLNENITNEQLLEEVQALRHQVYWASNKLIDMENTIENQQNLITSVVQAINQQIELFNKFNQMINDFDNKFADTDIRNNAIEDSMREVLNANNGLLQEMHELKNSISAIKFYSFNSMTSNY